MGYLDNSSITVDAVLTKKGREILKNGGNLNITSFTLSDTKSLVTREHFDNQYKNWNNIDSLDTESIDFINLLL